MGCFYSGHGYTDFAIDWANGFQVNDMNSDQYLYSTERNEGEIKEDQNDKSTCSKQKKAKMKTCSNCKEQESENSKLKNDLKERHREIQDLKDEMNQLHVENQLVRESSDNLTKKMAQTLENQNIFEDVSNPLSSGKLTERFRAIYDKDFLNVSMALDGVYNDEIKVIKHLTNFMKVAYEGCCKRAKQQMRQFLLLDDGEEIPSRQEIPELYRIRCEVGAKVNQKNKVVQEIINNIFIGTSEIIHDAGKEDNILDFLTEFTECAWLMTISDTQLDLNFDVVDCRYTGIIAKQFTAYATSVEVQGPVNTITCVVWPSVTSQNGQDLYAKGEVIVTTTQSETNGIVCEQNGGNETALTTEDGDHSRFLNPNAKDSQL